MRKGTMEVVALILFDKYCKQLDKKFEDAFNLAFEGERVGIERRQRIVDRFIEKLREVK